MRTSETQLTETRRGWTENGGGGEGDSQSLDIAKKSRPRRFFELMKMSQLSEGNNSDLSSLYSGPCVYLSRAAHANSLLEKKLRADDRALYSARHANACMHTFSTHTPPSAAMPHRLGMRSMHGGERTHTFITQRGPMTSGATARRKRKSGMRYARALFSDEKTTNEIRFSFCLFFCSFKNRPLIKDDRRFRRAPFTRRLN